SVPWPSARSRATRRRWRAVVGRGVAWPSSRVQKRAERRRAWRTENMELPDLASVRAFLRASCDADVVLDDLEIRDLQAEPSGPVRVLYEGPGRGGELLRVAARRLGPAKGRRLEAAINVRCVPSPAGFRQAALYAPAWELLFQIFPADQRLTSLPVATDA